MRMRAALLSLFAIVPLTAADAAEERRVALILGNGAYSAGALHAPVKDATDLAGILKDKLGFEVVVERDSSAGAMHRLIAEFKQRSQGARYALIYFGGYSVNNGAESYLLGVDSKLGAQAAEGAVSVSELVASIDGKVPDAAVLLDASYQNAALAKLNNAKAKPGLAHIPDARDGIAVISAQQPGRVTANPETAGGVLATALNIWLEKPKPATWGRLFDGLYETVTDATRSEQEPWLAASKGTRVRVAALTPTLPQPRVVQAGLTPQIFGTAPDSSGQATPSLTAVPAPDTPANLSDEQIALNLQNSLREKQCFSSAADGKWGESSREALARFVEVASAAGSASVLRDIDPSKAPTREIMEAVYSPAFREVRCPFSSQEPPVARKTPADKEKSSPNKLGKGGDEPKREKSRAPRNPGLAKGPGPMSIPQF